MQSVKHSWIEVVCNIGTGFVISAFLQHYVVNPLWDLQMTPGDSVGITVFFTVVSVLRSFVFRRLFNKIGHKQ